MQWQKMDWPIMVDSLNLLGVSAVPITLFIDEEGIIRAINPEKQELSEFLEADFSTVRQSQPRTKRDGDRKVALLEEGNELFLWDGSSKLGDVIAAYKGYLEEHPESGVGHFRLGVAYRSRYDSPFGESGDFSKAISHWKKALDIDPNQYIWRRRIQQYGPRFDKPYSFYDWIHSAREEILARGEEPVELSVEPGGAEFAHPEEELSLVNSEEEPDPEGRIFRDKEGLIKSETIVVPHTDTQTASARVHVLLTPNEELKAHWNNEAGNMVFWVNPPEGWTVSPQRIELVVPPVAVSKELRRVEFEVQGPADPKLQDVRLQAYALYYVCEDIDGTCLYRRQDIPIDLNHLEGK